MPKLIDIFRAVYRFSELMQRTFKYGKIQNRPISLAPDKGLNSLIYRPLSYVTICRSYKLLTLVQFFSTHPVFMYIYIGSNWPADRQSFVICPPPPQALVY